METHIESLGTFVVARREQLGLSLTALALRSGLSKSELSGIEHGRIKQPGPEKLRPLAEALRATHAELLVVIGLITADEVVEGANVYDPERKRVAAAATANLFPEQSPAAKVVALLRDMTDEDAALVLGTARFLSRHRRGQVDEEDRNVVVNVNTERNVGS